MIVTIEASPLPTRHLPAKAVGGEENLVIATVLLDALEGLGNLQSVMWKRYGIVTVTLSVTIGNTISSYQTHSSFAHLSAHGRQGAVEFHLPC
jgi:hypothetical protein